MDQPLRVAVVGAGPAGFYAVDALLKSDIEVRCDLFDRLPTPFGLVRGGVAPDHQKIKAVARTYDALARRSEVRFFGNVVVGRDLSVTELAQRYHHIVYAVGAEDARRLGIEGEDLAGVHDATDFVGWYNAHPDHQSHTFDLAGSRRVLVVGNGNVAMDVTRVLSRSPADFASTDMSARAIGALEGSGIRDVLVVGRRGPAQAAFSPKEIKEIGSLPDVALVVAPDEVALDSVSERWLATSAPRSAHRNLAYLTARSQDPPPEPGQRRVQCVFRESPVQFLGTNGRVDRVVLERNELREDARGVPRPHPTGQRRTLDIDLVFLAIGYRGVPVPGVPFADGRGIIPNTGGRVVDPYNNRPLMGQYVVGWAKRGPSGLIGSNAADSKATVGCMLEDVEQTSPAPKDPEDLPGILAARGVRVVTYEDWQRLDAHEREVGEERGKVREKLLSVDAMLEVLGPA